MTGSEMAEAPYGSRGGADEPARRISAWSVLVFWPWAAAVLSGVSLTLCFPPWNISWLCWVALTPLICAVWFGARGRGLKSALLGYLAGLAFFWGAFYWLTTVTGLGWFILAFYMALYFAFWGWFLGACARPKDFEQPGVPPGSRPPILSSRRNLRLGLLGAAAWVAQEAARGIVFSGFGWNGAGVALYRELPFIQIADVTGVAGVSFLVVLCNLMIVITIWRLVREVGHVQLRPHWDFSLTIVLLMAVFVYGIRAMQRAGKGVPLKVASVQADIPQEEKFDSESEAKIMDRYRRLTEAASAYEPDLVLWPEAATPRAMFGDRVSYEFVKEMSRLGSYAFLLGTIDFDASHDFNAAVLLTGQGPPQIYRKMHLVPFGEYIPFRHSFPLFAWIVGDLVPGDFSAGSEQTIFRMNRPPVKLGPLICFEDTLGDLTRQFVRRGADVLVNVTNDGWFKRSAGAEQHLANAVFRAVENRRPLLRSANTGVTAFIDVHGGIRQALRNETGSPFIEGVLFGKVMVPTSGRMTFYTRHGEVFSIVMSVVTGLAIGAHLLARRKTA